MSKKVASSILITEEVTGCVGFAPAAKLTEGLPEDALREGWVVGMNVRLPAEDPEEHAGGGLGIDDVRTEHLVSALGGRGRRGQRLPEWPGSDGASRPDRQRTTEGSPGCFLAHKVRSQRLAGWVR